MGLTLEVRGQSISPPGTPEKEDSLNRSAQKFPSFEPDAPQPTPPSAMIFPSFLPGSRRVTVLAPRKESITPGSRRIFPGDSLVVTRLFPRNRQSSYLLRPPLDLLEIE